MGKIIRLTEQDLVRLVNKIIKEDVEAESPGDTVQGDWIKMGFKEKPTSQYSYNFISVKPQTKPNISCEIKCRKDAGNYCNPENGYQVVIKFNRKVQQAEGFWTNKNNGGPLADLNETMAYQYDMNGISTLTKENASTNDVENIIRLYNKVKFQ